MTVWDHAFTIRAFVLDVSLVSALLLLGTVARRYVGFFQRFLIPNSLIAGFAGLILGPELLRLVDFDLERMGVYVYHLLALTFIGVGLRGPGSRRSRGALNFGFIMIMSYLLQALVGLAIALALMYFVLPDLVPAVGMLLPLGFGMGPGIAYTIGQSWSAFGFGEGGAIGLTMAAIGFLVAYLSGIAAINRGIRKGHSTLVTHAGQIDRDMRTGLIRDAEPAVGARLTLFSGAIEPLTFHMALVGGIYLLSYAVASGLSVLLVAAGLEQEVTTLWSFNFILANLLALVVRWILDRRRIAYLIDEGLVNRLTGLLADYLIAASVMAISLSVAWQYLFPILVLCTVGAAVTFFSIRWASARVFSDYHFERFVGVYGEMTGTISSGLALVRVTDPEYATPVAQDLVLGSGFALVLGFPLLVVINMPFTLFGGALEGYGYVIAILAVYLGAILTVWTRFGLQRRSLARL